jgi:rhodanese-related sulfurtransferase/polyisoprenoid-binding protein YceI
MALQLMSPEVLHKSFEEKKPIALIDVLVDEHFKAVHLPGAMNACVYEIVFLENMAKLIPDKDREIVVYGSGGRSLEAINAAEKLVNAGYRNVGMLRGGLDGWKELGYALEGEDTAILERAEQALPFVDARYVVDTGQSIINWFGRNKTTTHRGMLRFSSGEFSFYSGELEGAFEVDMTSIENIDLEGDPRQPQLIGHLKSADFFFVEMFPRASFTITSARRIEAVPSSLPNFRVQGIFNLRGAKKEIEFSATASPLQDGELKVETHFDIDRTRWGVLYGSSRFFEHLGYHLVYHHVSLQLRLVARMKM